jgi:hypothetical protein
MQPHASALGESYYIDSGGVIHIQGGAITASGNMTNSCGLFADANRYFDTCYIANITVKGTVARYFPNPYSGQDTTVYDKDTCDYRFEAYLNTTDFKALQAKAPGQTGVGVNGWEIVGDSIGGYSNGDHGAKGDCKSGSDVLTGLAQPSFIPLLSAADAAAAAQCAQQGGTYDATVTPKKCNLPTCPQLAGVSGAVVNGTYIPASKNCAYIKSQFPGGVCPTGTTAGNYNNQAVCFGVATAAAPPLAGATAEPDLCPIEKGTALRWIACPIIDGGQALTNGLDSIINYFLTINTSQIYGDTKGSASDAGDPNTPTSNGFYKAWSSFRNLGIGLVVIAGLIMVVSEALNLQIVDAYTIRKVLPRLLIAVIGISVSWSFMYFMITLFNKLGIGMSSLIYSSFSGVQGVSTGTGTAAIFASYFAVGGGLLALGFLGMLSFLGTLILALIVGVAVLVLREGIILMSIIIAPLAIASYVLPNTSKFASFWWSTFFKALSAFPIITGFIAICKVMAVISGKIQ